MKPKTKWTKWKNEKTKKKTNKKNKIIIIIKKENKQKVKLKKEIEATIEVQYNIFIHNNKVILHYNKEIAA